MTRDQEIRAIKREAGQIWARIEQDYINLRSIREGKSAFPNGKPDTERLKYAQIRLQELRNRLQELERSDEK